MICSIVSFYCITTHKVVRVEASYLWSSPSVTILEENNCPNCVHFSSSHSLCLLSLSHLQQYFLTSETEKRNRAVLKTNLCLMTQWHNVASCLMSEVSQDFPCSVHLSLFESSDLWERDAGPLWRACYELLYHSCNIKAGCFLAGWWKCAEVSQHS